jgi:DNA-binding CsgD family transcriptional regulator
MIELVGSRLAEHRLVSLVGPGGCGKTRLAIEVFISVPTVKSHINSIFAKVGTKNRGQLAAAAHRIEAP